MFQFNGSLEPKCERDQECAGWVTNSDVVHAVSKTPHGPYRAADIALGPRGRIRRKAGCEYSACGRVCLRSAQSRLTLALLRCRGWDSGDGLSGGGGQ